MFFSRASKTTRKAQQFSGKVYYLFGRTSVPTFASDQSDFLRSITTDLLLPCYILAGVDEFDGRGSPQSSELQTSHWSG